jgi:uncharacterized protein YndB with AHSA1/START domain
VTQLAEILSGDSLRIERIIAASPQRIWDHLVDPEKRARWFCAGDTLSDVGQEFELRFNHTRITDDKPPEKYKSMDASQPDFVSKGRVLAFEPPRLLKFAWSESEGPPSEVLFELAPHGDATRLVITHTKLPNRKELIGVGAGWNAHLGVLEDELAGKPHRAFWADIVRFEADLERIVPQ